MLLMWLRRMAAEHPRIAPSAARVAVRVGPRVGPPQGMEQLSRRIVYVRLLRTSSVPYGCLPGTCMQIEKEMRAYIQHDGRRDGRRNEELAVVK